MFKARAAESLTEVHRLANPHFEREGATTRRCTRRDSYVAVVIAPERRAPYVTAVGARVAVIKSCFIFASRVLGLPLWLD
ncbi:hypothetical protein EVAR_19783_1 [Eumeta japonica]|uniref:Uncharacterized protein n=1 Tax=Eumeta variegata TaxID=151549 RepID=A0A4C1UQM5_EUMVA|nr:hypothetical protein EVAR_19783_1 [Eumeta japonica]